MMAVLAEWRFWVAGIGALAGLSAFGTGIAWVALPPPPAYHRTSFFEFPLPPDWACDRDGTETVCRPRHPPPHQAIIVFAAKWRGPNDSMAFYRQHLETARNRDSHGAPRVSTVLSVREVELGGRRWIDGRHRDSELPGYETRYLAAVTADLGVLITYSFKNGTGPSYEPLFEKAIRGLLLYQRDRSTEAP
jgi:hypothetical protein